MGAARSSLKAAAATTDLVRHSPGGTTILIYHRVGAGSGGQMDIEPSRFEEQLAWLSTNAEVISLDEALLRLGSRSISAQGVAPAGNTGHGSRPEVVITFDDGTTDWVDHVLPALERHRLPATFYVATSFIEERTALPGEGRPVSWAGLSEMSGSDLVTIGAHTHRHMLLDRLAESEIADELDRCSELLAENTGQRPDHFAYPKAVAGSAEAENAVRQRYRSAVLAGTRANLPGVDPYRLARSPIQASDDGLWFRLKAKGGMRFEDDFRQLANRLRYRKLTS